MWNNTNGASKNTKNQQEKKENITAVVKEPKKLDFNENSSLLSKILSWFK